MNMKVENEMALPITKSVTVMLLEPYAGKLARTVLRGESSRKGADPLDYRSSHLPDKQIPGIGLGLSYVRQIVEAHHGSVSLRSELGEGTRITINLPTTAL